MIDLIQKHISKDKLPYMLRLPFVYSLGKALVRRRRLQFPFRASAMMAEYGLEQYQRIYRRGTPFVWTSAFFPTEILHALGISSFSPEIASALAASFGFQHTFLEAAESRWWGRDNCSFHRSAMGGLFLDCYPVPRAFCASSHLCEGAVFMFSTLAGRYRRPFLLLDTPLEENENSLSYVTGQLRELISSLEEISAARLQQEKLEEAVLNAEAARRAMLKVNELRLHPLSPFTAKNAFGFLYLFFTGLGSTAMPRIYESLAAELAEKIKVQQERHSKGQLSRFRLLWLHLPPFYKNNILSYLEENGARVVFEDFSHVYWETMDARSPLESIAKRMLSHFNYGHIDRRIKVIKELSRRYKVDGVVHFSHWGCRQSSGSLRIIRKALQEEGLPLLVLDGDCIDGRNFSWGQVQTRIEGFLEMLA